MSEWELATAVLILGLLPCGAVCLRGSFADGVVGAQLAATVSALALLLIAEDEVRQPFASLAVVLVVLSLAGTLIFARYLERQR
jgi:multicomponent Na+:H+ antiporter subunit F